MTLLTTAQQILKQTKEATIPNTIIGNNNATQILEAMTLAVVSASRAYDWQELQKEHTFASVASTVGYAVPSDFDRMINNTFWNSSNNQRVLGPKTPQQWRHLNNSTSSNASSSDYFRIRDKEVQIFPTPSSVENFVYEYITNLIVEDSGGTGQTGWEADTDVPVIDEYLIKLNATWIFLKMQGRPYAEEQREYDLAAAERASVNGARETIYHTGNLSDLDKSKIGYPDLVPSA